MLATFFYSQGIIYKKFVAPGQTVNKKYGYYVQILSCLVQIIYHVRPQFQERESWFLLHDYARPHSAISVKQFLAKQGIQELNHPPYSSELSPPASFLFLKIKSMLKGRRFEDMEDIKRNVTKELLALHANELKKSFQQFLTKYKSV
jgi:hypothetical protein